MKTFKVEIMPCGTKAKTVNHFGIKKDNLCVGWWPNDGRYGTHEEYEEKWQQAESERKVYEIDLVKCICIDKDEKACAYPDCGRDLKPGTIVEATEINTKQIRIL